MSKPTGLVIPPGANAVAVPVVSARYYDPTSYLGGAITTTALAANGHYAVPMVLYDSTLVAGIALAITRIAFDITTAAAAGKKVRIGLYDATPGTLYPRTLLADGGEFASDATGPQEATVAISVVTGTLFWLDIWGDGAPTLRSFTAGNRIGAASNSYSGVNGAYVASVAYTAGSSVMPASYPASAAPSPVNPKMMVKIA